MSKMLNMMEMMLNMVIMMILPTRRQEAATPTNTAMRMFQNKDRTGNELLDSSLPTTHQNQVNVKASSFDNQVSSQIMELRIMSGSKEEATSVSTRSPSVSFSALS